MARVVIIDDEQDLLEVCQLVLEDAGFAVKTVAHAEQQGVLQLVRDFEPDVILLDLIMPWASGDDVAAWLRADPRAQKVPVLVMSALSDADTKAQLLGASGFLAKPFTETELIGGVARLAAHPPPCEPRHRG